MVVNIEVFLTEKGKPLLIFGSYIYHLERKTDSKRIFRCENRDCKGRLHTNVAMNSILKDPVEHFHAPNLNKISVIKLKNEIKSHAIITEESPSNIIHVALKEFPLEAAGALPKNESLTRLIRRQREPENEINDIRIPGNLRTTYRNDNFILYEDNNLVIFTTAANLSILKSCKHWFADGTFKVCPDDFYQLFTLHGLFTSQIIPLVYGLLIGKKADDYDDFFNNILKEDTFSPESILTDFESGTIKSIRTLFPNVLHKGCLFHYGQAVWRQINTCGLATKYSEDKKFHLAVKNLIGLAFVPISDLVSAFELLEPQFDDDADEFIYYIEKTWIGEKKRRAVGRKKPLFAHELWNTYDRVLNNLPRSNNSIEAWHHAFAKRVAINHPTVPKLLEQIRREQSMFEIAIEQVYQGCEPRPQKPIYKKIDERFKRLVQGYDNNHLPRYLDGVAVIVSL